MESMPMFGNGSRTHELCQKCKMESMPMFGNGSRTHEHIESVLKPDQCSRMGIEPMNMCMTTK
jgi:hypothetical protein